MKLDEVIRHAEEQADLLEESAKGCDLTDKVEKEIAYKSAKCAKGHRQLARWLESLKRAKILLTATYQLLNKQERSPIVLNILSQTVFYDEAECDGTCLMEDIEALLEEIEE